MAGWPMFSLIEHGAVIPSSDPLYALPQFMRRSGGQPRSPDLGDWFPSSPPGDRSPDRNQRAPLMLL
jgi:hypothetical protein